MLALRKIRKGKGGLSLDQVECREPGPGEVLLKVDAAGICGTDMHIYHWAQWLEGRLPLPVTLGHEVSGVVAKCGPGVKRLTEGTVVALESHLPCGRCNVCLRGQAHICPNTKYPGMDFDGGFAAYTVVPEEICWPIPQGLSPAVASLFEPFGIGVHSCTVDSGVQGQSVIVSGCGPIGLMAIVAARELGAAEVIALEVNPKRLKHAEQLGATRAFNPREISAEEMRKQINSGEGADVFLEYSGAQQSLDAIPTLARNGASLRLIGVPDGAAPVNLSRWILKGFRVEGIHGRKLHETWVLSQKMLPRVQKELATLVSHELPLEDGLRGFDILEQGQGVKVVFRP
jgi:threonine 3-dehydrogenase